MTSFNVGDRVRCVLGDPNLPFWHEEATVVPNRQGDYPNWVRVIFDDGTWMANNGHLNYWTNEFNFQLIEPQPSKIIEPSEDIYKDLI